jgi:hypothetical protein
MENIMSDRKFKIGVSDWEFYFSGRKIKLDSLTKENVTLYADGKARIILDEISFNKEYIELFKTGAFLSRVMQQSNLVNSLNKISDTIEYEYKNLMIEKIKLISSNDSVTIAMIVLKTQE